LFFFLAILRSQSLALALALCFLRPALVLAHSYLTP
jgi:hypothetical protein